MPSIVPAPFRPRPFLAACLGLVATAPVMAMEGSADGPLRAARIDGSAAVASPALGDAAPLAGAGPASAALPPWQPFAAGLGGGGQVLAGQKDWFYKMDFGPVLADTITAPMPGLNIAYKGHAVRLTATLANGSTVLGGMCFDADLLRMSAGWTGGYLKLMGVAYEGHHGVPGPKIDGTQIFGTSQTPGWSNGDSFADPRSEPFGPLPRTWARFKGQYIHGDQVVFAYSVGSGSVLDLPGFEAGGSALSRTLALTGVGPSSMLVAELPEGTGSSANGIATLSAHGTSVVAGLVHAPDGVSLVVQGNRILMRVAQPTTGTFKVVIGSDPAQAATLLAGAQAITDPSTLIHGGPVRFPRTVQTVGTLGQGHGPYVVDTITLPFVNPYNARMRLGGFDFFSDGRAAVCTWNGDVWIVSGIDATLQHLTWKRFASGLHQPLGLKIVADQVYVTTRDGIERLVDLNHDGEASFYEAFNNDVHTSSAFHEFAFDLWTDPEGNFYYTKAGGVHAGGRGFEHVTESNGVLFKVAKDGSSSSIVATGLRAANGMSVSPTGVITCGDNEGTWTPSSRVNLVTQGGFYGVPPLSHRTPEPTSYDPPILWIKHNNPGTLDNSCGGQAWVTSNRWGPLQGQLLHLSYGTCLLFAVAYSTEGAIPQGGCVPFPLTFSTGIMRARFNDLDGQLYLCGLHGWQTTGTADGGFFRVRYTGGEVVLPVGYKVFKNGIRITFSAPLDRASASDKQNYVAHQWNYVWSNSYGSPEVSVLNPKERGHDPVTISSVTLSNDGRSLFLEMPAIRPVMQMEVVYHITSATGQPVPGPFENTINVVPDVRGP